MSNPIPSYTFTQKAPPTEPNQQSNYGNVQRDGSKQMISGFTANGIQTQDFTGTPVKSPQTIANNSVVVLNTPPSAGSITITATAFTLFVSEVGVAAASSLATYDIIPVGATKTYELGNEGTIYLLGGTGSCIASFYYNII